MIPSTDTVIAGRICYQSHHAISQLSSVFLKFTELFPLIIPKYELPFADNIFKCFVFKENVGILIQISLEFVSTGNKLALVRVMAWCWSGKQPLPELMMIQFHDWPHQQAIGSHSADHYMPIAPGVDSWQLVNLSLS